MRTRYSRQVDLFKKIKIKQNKNDPIKKNNFSTISGGDYSNTIELPEWIRRRFKEGNDGTPPPTTSTTDRKSGALRIIWSSVSKRRGVWDYFLFVTFLF